MVCVHGYERIELKYYPHIKLVGKLIFNKKHFIISQKSLIIKVKTCTCKFHMLNACLRSLIQI